MTFRKIDVLDKGYVRLVEPWGFGDAGEPEAGIIEAARQSTQGSFRGWDWNCDTCGDRRDEKFLSPHKNWNTGESCYGKVSSDTQLIKYLYTHQHSTPFEFAGMTIETKLPIFVAREWMRHRTQSFNEMSARYAPLPNEAYVPTVERLMAGGGHLTKQAGSVGDVELTYADAMLFNEDIADFYQDAEELYQRALNTGVPKELARLVLPVGRYTQMRASANLRNWIGFLKLRQDPTAQQEIREYADAIASIIETQFNKTYQLYKTGNIER